MRSHIHELWEDLELSPQYPEPDLDRVMDRVMDQIEAEEPEHPASQTRRRRPMHKKKLLLSLAAALVVLTGSAVAVANHYGVLDLFFTGDTSQLEPYVQTDLGSAENEDYRFTVNSAYYDGMTVYATVTVEGLNEQAVEDLKSSRADADAHREMWGDELADNMIERRGSGPDTIRTNAWDVVEAARPGERLGGSGGSSEIQAPSDTSRSWRVRVMFECWLGPLDTPLKLWANWMGEEYAVEVPLDTVAGSVHLEPNQEFLFNPLNGQRAILTEATLTPTLLYYEIQSVGERKTDTGWDAMDGRFILKMKDGSLITSSQLGHTGGGSYDWNNNHFIFRVDFTAVKFTDVNEVESVIFGDTEFPLDGSEPTLAKEDERFYPFYVSYYDEDGPWYTDVEALCRGLGAEYIWDEDTQTATATYRDVTIQMTVGSNRVLVNGEPLELTGDVQDEEHRLIEDAPQPIQLKNGVLIAPNYLFSHDGIAGGVWDIDISMLHLDGLVTPDPNRVVVLP